MHSHPIYQGARVSLGLVLLLAAVGCSSTPTTSSNLPAAVAATPWPPTVATHISPTPRREAFVHIVQAGETLSHIAKQYGISVAAIAAANGLTDPNRIRVGQQLTIPHPAAAPPPNAATPSTTPSPEFGAAPSNLVPAQVVDVVDGDTIKVSIGGNIYTVRYIGIDCPETHHPQRGLEWLGPEAAEQNRHLVEGKTVSLEKDISETDKYGRLLRYVWLGDLMVNAELVRLGFAQVATYPPDVKYQELFLRLEQEARAAGRGLWATRPAPTATPDIPGLPERADCSPCYPSVCIPPPPPDLDCPEIPYRRFQVVGCDPHRFDGDHDGIGCER